MQKIHWEGVMRQIHGTCAQVSSHVAERRLKGMEYCTLYLVRRDNFSLSLISGSMCLEWRTRATSSIGTGVTDIYEVCGSWAMNPCPLQVQEVSLLGHGQKHTVSATIFWEHEQIWKVIFCPVSHIFYNLCQLSSRTWKVTRNSDARGEGSAWWL